MPFPLAHPAAMFPLRRWCPRWFSFPALVLGSLSPDAGYVLSRYQLDQYSHQWLGIIGFSLPVSLVALWLLYRFRVAMTQCLPARYRPVFSPLCQRPPGAPLTMILSVIVGAASHLLWDSFTHGDGWLVEHLAVLQYPVAMVGHRTVRVCHLLWYASTLGGVLWLGMVFQRWREDVAIAPKVTSSAVKFRNAVLASLVILALAAWHHLGHGLGASLLVASGSFFVIIGFVMWVGK
jgi:hypothetical protein